MNEEELPPGTSGGLPAYQRMGGELPSEKPAKKWLKLGVILAVIVVIIISSILLIPHYFKGEETPIIPEEEEEEEEPEKGEEVPTTLQNVIPEEVIEWCVDNTQPYIRCHTFQKRDKGYCESAYNKMDASVNDIEEEKNECLFNLELLKLANSGKPTECSKIAQMEGYDKEDSWIVSFCYMLAADSKDACKEIDSYASMDAEEYPGERKEFCNLFFDCLETENFEGLDNFKKLDSNSQEWIVILKATKKKDDSLCEKIQTDYLKMYCKVWAGASDAKSDDFCDPLLDYCSDPKTYNPVESPS